MASFYLLVVAAGFEPAIAWMKTMCPRPLDDATTPYIIAIKVKKCKCSDSQRGNWICRRVHLDIFLHRWILGRNIW